MGSIIGMFELDFRLGRKHGLVGTGRLHQVFGSLAIARKTGPAVLCRMRIDHFGIPMSHLKDKTLYKPRGCDYCTGTGFRGRVGIFEMMVLNNEIRTLAFERAATNKVRKAAIASGMKSLLQDGKLKVLNGITTAEEIVKVAQVEGVITSE